MAFAPKRAADREGNENKCQGQWKVQELRLLSVASGG